MLSALGKKKKIKNKEEKILIPAVFQKETDEVWTLEKIFQDLSMTLSQ